MLGALAFISAQISKVIPNQSLDPCEMNLEGVIAKRTDSPYVSRRTTDWLKLKCGKRQESVIVGCTDRKGSANAAAIGSLLLAVHDEQGKLVSAGSVGTGWDTKAATALKKRLVKLEDPASPIDDAVPGKRKRWARALPVPIRWVKPKLVAEVSFAGWTPEQQIRHASFQGLRSDKPAKAITRDVPVRPEGAQSMTHPADGPRIDVTHAERIIDSTTKLTKLDLVRYYESVAKWMVPHLKGRPCSLVRGPSGVAGQLFFQ